MIERLLQLCDQFLDEPIPEAWLVLLKRLR